MKLGIVGLPNVGKSTLFNAITSTKNAEAANYPFCTIEPNSGIVAVPDKRLDKLADYQTNPNMALVSYFMCAKTDEEAYARAEGAPFFQFALRFYGASSGRQRPPPGTVRCSWAPSFFARSSM